jgi:hypothetical protein
VITERIPRSSDLLVALHRDLGEACATSSAGLPESGSGRPRSSKVVGIVDKVSGPTCRSAGLLAGQVHLIGTFVTLVGGDPWVPMSLKPPIDV